MAQVIWNGNKIDLSITPEEEQALIDAARLFQVGMTDRDLLELIITDTIASQLVAVDSQKERDLSARWKKLPKAKRDQALIQAEKDL